MLALGFSVALAPHFWGTPFPFLSLAMFFFLRVVVGNEPSLGGYAGFEAHFLLKDRLGA